MVLPVVLVLCFQSVVISFSVDNGKAWPTGASGDSHCHLGERTVMDLLMK